MSQQDVDGLKKLRNNLNKIWDELDVIETNLAIEQGELEDASEESIDNLQELIDIVYEAKSYLKQCTDQLDSIQ